MAPDGDAAVAARAALQESADLIATMPEPLRQRRPGAACADGGAASAHRQGQRVAVMLGQRSAPSKSEIVASARCCVALFLQRAATSSRRIAATCTGVFFLADAGIVEGKRVTTHWFFADDLRARYPTGHLAENRLFVVDGHIWTSAGMSAGIDQALAMVEADLGADLARAVATNLVLPYRRAGGLRQSSALLELEPRSDRVQQALAYAQRHLGSQVTVERLAAETNLSLRQFSRLFLAEIGTTPAKALERLRVEKARVLLQDGSHPIQIVARDTGFGDRERMRRAFIRVFGQPPQTVRRDAKAAAKRDVIGQLSGRGLAYLHLIEPRASSAASVTAPA